MAVERTMAAMDGVQGLGEREGSSTARRPVRAYVEVAHIVFFEARVASTVLHSSCTPRRAKQGSGMYDIRLSLPQLPAHTHREPGTPPPILSHHAMADSLPAKLKAAQIAPFIQRAHQLEPYKPFISYWRTCRAPPTLHSATDQGQFGSM